MRIWKPVYILLERWRFEFSCKWIGISLHYKSPWELAGYYETGIKLGWWPVKHKTEGCSKYVYHWEEVIRTSFEDVAAGGSTKCTR